MKKVLLLLVVAVLVISVATYLKATDHGPKRGDLIGDLPLTFLGTKPDLNGKPLLIEFWATWCSPCRESIPHLNQVFDKYKGSGLQIVGVTNEDEATVKKFEQKLPIEYNVAINAPSSLYTRFGIDGIPQAFLVSKEGRIVWSGHPLELTELELKSVL